MAPTRRTLGPGSSSSGIWRGWHTGPGVGCRSQRPPASTHPYRSGRPRRTAHPRVSMRRSRDSASAARRARRQSRAQESDGAALLHAGRSVFADAVALSSPMRVRWLRTLSPRSTPSVVGDVVARESRVPLGQPALVLAVLPAAVRLVATLAALPMAAAPDKVALRGDHMAVATAAPGEERGRSHGASIRIPVFTISRLGWHGSPWGAPVQRPHEHCSESCCRGPQTAPLWSAPRRSAVAFDCRFQYSVWRATSQRLSGGTQELWSARAEPRLQWRTGRPTGLCAT